MNEETKKKKIAFVSYNLVSGGAERVLTTLANKFCDTFEVYIITLEDCTSFYPLDSRIKRLHCNLKAENKSITLSRLYDYWKTVQNLKNHIKTNEISLCISFLTATNVFTILASKWCGRPCIISERNNPIVNSPSFFWKKMRNLIYRFSNALVVQTKANKAFYSDLMPDKRIHIVPNPLEPNLASKRILPKTYAKENTILSVGRLDNNKAQGLLIRAFANIQNENWKVQLVGDGSAKENYESLAEDLGVADRIEFLGNCKDVWTFYNKATIFAFTSRSEGFPNALTEAMYYGIPSISTDCPHGPSELIVNGENGFLIEVDDQAELENKLSKLMADEPLRSKMGNKAMEDLQAFEIDKIKSRWEKLMMEFLI
ncbi:glycosyltransferase family 4 protein [Spongiimicrobium sp. 3-5]|uniref:glycosyltransferase family 4 protein n=1 Tax=Spongiimicrobium sp. 3-5 TaxID=3332596 RepID=UPI00397FEE3C